MNFAEPSGSSPAEKPPGMKRICDSPIFEARVEIDSAMCFAERLRKTSMWVCAPTRWKARAESYSELVPGKVGMSTRGWIDDCRLLILDF